MDAYTNRLSKRDMGCMSELMRRTPRLFRVSTHRTADGNLDRFVKQLKSALLFTNCPCFFSELLFHESFGFIGLCAELHKLYQRKVLRKLVGPSQAERARRPSSQTRMTLSYLGKRSASHSDSLAQLHKRSGASEICFGILREQRDSGFAVGNCLTKIF